MYAANASLSGTSRSRSIAGADEHFFWRVAWAAGNSLVFGEYISKAILNREPSSLTLEMTAFACMTFTFLLHGTALNWGLRLQNVLGLFQLLIISAVVATGYVALRQGLLTETGSQRDRWRGRDNFRDVWGGTSGSMVALCTALYSVSFCFSSFLLFIPPEIGYVFRSSGPFAVSQMPTMH
jgi:hypothetical protein